MKELTSFVEDTAHGLSNKVADGDYTGLVNIMGHLMAIRDRQISNEQHFKPLKSTAELLKTYGQQLPESIYAQLEVCAKALKRTFGEKRSCTASLSVSHHHKNTGAAGEVEEPEEDCIHG